MLGGVGGGGGCHVITVQGESGALNPPKRQSHTQAKQNSLLAIINVFIPTTLGALMGKWRQPPRLMVTGLSRL